MKYQDTAWTILKNKGYKKTKQRIQVLSIIDATDLPLSFTDIVKKSVWQWLDEVTVYRFLHILEELHLVKKLSSLRSYIKCDWSHHPHNHYFFVCNDCHTVSEKVIHDTNSWWSLMWVFPDHQSIEIVWICKSCNNNNHN